MFSVCTEVAGYLTRSRICGWPRVEVLSSDNQLDVVLNGGVTICDAVHYGSLRSYPGV